jgi:beta-galactosidase
MKISVLPVLCALLVALSAHAQSAHAQSIRQTFNFNREWQFQLGDHPGAEKTTFDDAAWSRIGLPHSFSLPYFASKHFYVGYGWYRKEFQVPAQWKGKRLFLDFEGAFQDAEVWVNGQKVGRHRGGYTGFNLDITRAARTGANVVAVRINNLWNARLAPRAGEHVFSGGIYRDVSLVVTNPVHTTWYGTYVTTPKVSRESATVRVQTEVINESGSARTVVVRQTVWAPDGKPVARWQTQQKVAPGQTALFDQTSPSISRPLLWHPDHPFLYTVTTDVLEGNRALDKSTSSLGFRWFKWTADKGFFLNGEHIYLYGANMHQDRAGWGDAATNADFERDLKMTKDAGFNAIRATVYPHDPAFSATCDRLGLLLWEENTFWGIGGFKPDGYWNSGAYPPDPKDQPEFEASVKQQLREMIRVHRNHPSVVVWSMCNEPFFSDTSVMPRVKSFLGELVTLSHQLDPTRPAALGGVQRPLDESRIDKVGDIAGYNGDGASIGIFQNPGLPNIVSEYSSTTATRPGDYKPGWDQLAKDEGKPVHAWRSGQIIWCMFDHGSIAGDNLGRMGIVDYFRIPKRAYYWYRNEYKHIPPPAWPTAGTPAKLRLQADKTTLKAVDGTDDTQLMVTVLDASGKELSNSVPVTLTLISGPGEFPTGPSITFEPKSDIAILDGKAAIEFRSYLAGTSVIRATSPGLPPAEIKIVSQGAPKWVAGKTPPVQPRPYVRYTQVPVSSLKTTPGLTLAADRPTKASSTAPNSSSASVNDGKIATLWQAAPTDKAPWIQVDLENTYTLNRVQLIFPAAGHYQYDISVSANGTNWTTVNDQSQSQSTEVERIAVGNLGSGVRFLRVTFSAWPPGKSAALAEIAVGGGTDLKFSAGRLSGTVIGTTGSWNDDRNTTREAAFDGNPATFFDAPNPDGSWVGLDLGRPTRISKIRFRPRAILPQRMVGGQFQGASTPDFENAVDLFTIKTSPDANTMSESTINIATPFRYVRYLSPDGGSGNIAELEFYEMF